MAEVNGRQNRDQAGESPVERCPMALRIDHIGRSQKAIGRCERPIGRCQRAWAGVATAATTLLLSVNAAAAQLPSPSPATQGNTNPLVTPSQAAAPGVGWGPGGQGQRSADARFIVMMIPHHQGAIAMSELALKRARRPEIKALAERIISSQSREIAQMRQWYRQWYGAEVPAWNVAAGPGLGPGMGMGPGMGIGPGMAMGPGMGRGEGMGMGWGMPGMATSLEALKTAPDFDRSFIEQMIPHHRMGVMMAAHAEWNSQHPELRAMEAAMVRVQTQEIEQMAQWYRQWFGA